MVADGDNSGCALHLHRIGWTFVAIGFHQLDLQRLAAVFNAKPHADIIGVRQLLGRTQEMDKRDFGKAGRKPRRGADEAIAAARRQIIQ